MYDVILENLINDGKDYNKLNTMNKIKFQLTMLFLQVCNERYNYKNLPSELPKWCIEKVLNLYGSGVLFKVGDEFVFTSAVPSSTLDIYNRPTMVQPVAMNGFSFPLITITDTIVENGGKLTKKKKDGVLIKNNLYNVPTYALIKPFIDKLCFIWESLGINAGLSRIIALIHCNKDNVGALKNEFNKIIGSNSGIALVGEKQNILDNWEKFDFNVEYTPDKYWEDFDKTFNLICQIVGINSDITSKKERLIVGELEANDEITTITDNTFFEFRKSAIKEINNTFNLNIKIEKVEDIKIKSPNIEKKEVN